MEKAKIFTVIIVGICIIGGFLYLGNTNQFSSVQSNLVKSVISTCQAKDATRVTKVIDGDTVVVQGGLHVRLLGIDADEKDYPCYELAKRRLEALVLNKEVRLERDVTDVDQYGRCLRTIFLEDENINLQMVKEGLVVASFYSPNITYKSQITAAENAASLNKTGCKWQ